VPRPPLHPVLPTPPTQPTRQTQLTTVPTIPTNQPQVHQETNGLVATPLAKRAMKHNANSITPPTAACTLTTSMLDKPELKIIHAPTTPTGTTTS
jgi:hypothetical protein